LFSTLANNMVYKIAWFQFWSGLYWHSKNIIFICQQVEYMYKITMLTHCLLNWFHGFSVYLIFGTRYEIWIFSKVKREVQQNVKPRSQWSTSNHVDPVCQSPSQVGLAGRPAGPLPGWPPHFTVSQVKSSVGISPYGSKKESKAMRSVRP
jgi:hypothetical protein